MENLFFYSTDNLIRILVSAPILYAAVIAFVRISGKRSTSQMNNFDWIVTVALGSMFASAIIFKDVTIIEVMLSIGVLLVLQYALTKHLVFGGWGKSLVKAQPTLLLRNGEYIPEAMKKERVTKEEILSAIRGRGIGTLDDVAAVVLEADAKMSVIRRSDQRNESRTTLDDVDGFADQHGQ